MVEQQTEMGEKWLAYKKYDFLKIKQGENLVQTVLKSRIVKRQQNKPDGIKTKLKKQKQTNIST